uniref:7TM_GPCR_Srx domain-containing protein n=1 Tax=Caenorhabditis tropicalis TaxID=1561998 RepID=A0A1I7UBW5_9PELO
MNSSEIPPNYKEWPNLVAGIMMTIDALFGLFLSGAIVYIYAKDTQQRTSFNLICAIRAINNCLVMITTFVLVYIPGSFL